MLSSILSFRPQSVQNKQLVQQNRYSNLSPLRKDTISFCGIGSIEQYDNIFDYLSAETLNTRYKIPADKLKNGKVVQILNDMKVNNELFKDYPKASIDDIKWKCYSPKDTREGTVQSVNSVRKERMDEWKALFDNPENYIDKNQYPELFSDLKNKDSLCLLIWHSITSDLKSNNKHIPLKIDLKSLDETVKIFKGFGERGLRPQGSFFEIYKDAVRNNVMISLGLDDKDSTWVKIPSLNNDFEHSDENLHVMEVLSHENWCTSASSFKANTALELGDTYIYMEHDKNGRWTPSLIMVSEQGKISQIQGVENNYLIPIDKLDTVKEFFEEHKNIQCMGDFLYDGPGPLYEIKIAEKLSTKDAESNRTLEQVLKDKDYKLAHKMLGHDVVEKDDGTIEISSYKSFDNLDLQRGIIVPYSMMGINEDAMLANVSKIEGDLVLYRNDVVKSCISNFPPKLKNVKGKIVCSQEQFDNFSEDILNAVGNNMKKVKIIRRSCPKVAPSY